MRVEPIVDAEKQILLRAPRARVWQALTTAKEFGSWFGASVDGAFVPGSTVKGPITIKNYEHVMFEATIERAEPGRRLAWRWHAHAVDKDVV